MSNSRNDQIDQRWAEASEDQKYWVPVEIGEGWQKLHSIEQQMDALFSEMRINLRVSGQSSVREFCVLKDKEQQVPAGWRFKYYEDDFSNLADDIKLLLRQGYITAVEPNIYRMTEEFAMHLLRR